jgi:hypothetical protein
MSSNRLKTLRERISYRIERGKNEVFIRGDFEDLSDYVQVGRILRQLVVIGKLIRIGYGLYAKATKSPISGETIPRKGINALAKEALERLNVKAFPSSYEKAYNEDRSTQVPTGRVIEVKSRISRKIGYKGRRVVFERVTRKQKTY